MYIYKLQRRQHPTTFPVHYQWIEPIQAAVDSLRIFRDPRIQNSTQDPFRFAAQLVSVFTCDRKFSPFDDPKFNILDQKTLQDTLVQHTTSSSNKFVITPPKRMQMIYKRKVDAIIISRKEKRLFKMDPTTPLWFSLASRDTRRQGPKRGS